MKRQTRFFVLSCLLTAGVMAFIFSNSLRGAQDSMAQSGLLMTLLRAVLDPGHAIPEETFHYFVRKGAHFSEFALLGAALWLLLRSVQRRFGVFCPGFMLFGALATAVTDEFIQRFTGRTSSVADVLIDFSGALLAFCILCIFHTVRKKKEKKHASKKCGTE